MPAKGRKDGFWRSKEGLAEVLKHATFHGAELLGAETWEKDAYTYQSRVKLQCTNCNEIKCPLIGGLVKSKSLGCSCKSLRGARISSAAGRLQFVERCAGKNLELCDPNQSWIAVTTKTKILVRCTVCTTQAAITFQGLKTGSICCPCNKGWNYSSAAGRQAILGRLGTTSFVPVGDLESEPLWLSKKRTSTCRFEARCTKCNFKTTQVINWFMTDGCIACDCPPWKTERMVFDFLKSHVPSGWSVSRSVSCRYNAKSKYDAALVDAAGNAKLYVEVDGQQHFLTNDMTGLFAKIAPEKQMERDLRKELEAAEDDVPLVRLFQPDVWRGKFDWQPFLLEKVLMVTSNVACVGVFRQPGCKWYTEGRYATMRQGTRVCVS